MDIQVVNASQRLEPAEFDCLVNNTKAYKKHIASVRKDDTHVNLVVSIETSYLLLHVTLG